jgi:ketosteroid isomerase-like protein
VFAQQQRFLDSGLPIDVRPWHVYVAGDIVLLIVDWSIDGAGHDGRRIRIGGVAIDVARHRPSMASRHR